MPKFFVIIEATADFQDVACVRIARKPCQNPGSICLGFPTYQAALTYILSSEE